MIPNTLPNIIVDLYHRVEELDRRFENRERTGTIQEVDSEKGMARVKLGDSKNGKPFLSPWIPWEMPAMGETKINIPPSVGQQVKISSESGDITDAVIRASLRSDENPLPAGEPGEVVIENTKGLRIKTPHYKVESGKIEYIKSGQGGSRPGASIA